MVETTTNTDFAHTLESLRKTYLLVSTNKQMPPQQMTCVYQWISALRSIECSGSYKKVCLRNQMALDLLAQLQFHRRIEWPFDQSQAIGMLTQMMAVAETTINAEDGS